MTEMFAAFHDALVRSTVPTYLVDMRRPPNHPRPWYLPSLGPPSKAAGRAQMLRLAAMVPGSVRGLDN